MSGGYFYGKERQGDRMIIQFLSKVDGKEINTILDGVSTITESDEVVNVTHSRNGSNYTTAYPKKNSQIYQMWLMNDEFKTLKRLI